MEPIFSGLSIEEDKLPAYAASAARLLRPAGEGSCAAEAAALRRNTAAVRRCCETVIRRYADAADPPEACRWLMGNWYLARREAAAALGDLRRAGRQRRTAEGQTLIAALCRSLLSSGQGRLDRARCAAYLRGFQQVTVLRRRELYLFPAAMRAAVLEAMARLCAGLPASADTREQARQLEALFSALRFLCGADMEELLRSADRCDGIFCGDPSGDYPRMDADSRRSYLQHLEDLARDEGCEESVLAERILRRAKEGGGHLGFVLFEDAAEGGAGLYIAAVTLLSLFLSLLLAFAAGSPWAVLLLLVPVSELVKAAVDLALLRAIPPRRLPRMDLSAGIPPEGKTICVFSALLTDEAEIRSLCRRMEETALGQHRAGPHLQFGLLADLPAAGCEHSDADDALLRTAREAVEQLNRRRGGGYYLFTRRRSFDGQRWTGRERKRGALLALARLLCGLDSELSVTGDRAALAGTRYILTLDSDTRMMPGAAAELIGAMLHPMNRPVCPGEGQPVRAGHGLIHPRLCTDLGSANASDFALIFAGPGGCDPYGSLGGELYMNAFDCGGFAGKGILDARVLLRCTEDRIPPGRVLSHDALEGALLRGAYLGDTVFADAFPSGALSYFRRLHRWTRGDWQNAPWLFRRGRDLRPIDRWRLFDSLRRSLFAPMTLSALLAGFFLPDPGLRLSAWGALLALLSGLMQSLLAEAGRHADSPRLRRYARLLTGVGGAIVRTFMRLWLLPWEAWTCLSAIVTALWRMLVSRRGLLDWETAAQSARRGRSFAAHCRAMVLPAALGLGCLLGADAVIGRAAGLLWLLSPAAAWAMSLPAFREEELSRSGRDWLRQRAAETWRYFSESCTEEGHFLPPDNVQHQPPKGPAFRTSPTNMGLAAAAAAAACDLELVSPADALAFLRRLIGGMELLPRCMGHFYNWYDIRTLQSLHPPFLSTVDSGNCFAGLRVAAAFAREQGDDALAGRIDALLEAMDFAPLYDPVKELFYICFDTSRRRGSGGWYDLMASEAMLTSYLAIARGDVPVRHWRRLGRGQLQKDGYRGLASWSGSMFEYLMPLLFLPADRGSLLYESSRFCLYAQRRCVPPGQPWGISESAYFSLDGSLNYRYAAHGCPALALRRSAERELVVAPYASFLALAVSPRAAVRNLRLLARRGLCGDLGFREALDLTPGRCRSPEGEIVDCTMVHHAGMSLLAAANALCRDSIRRRFMSDPAMSGHELLLQEQPGDGAVLRRSPAPPAPPVRPDVGRWSRRGVSGETGMVLLSNGVWSLLLDERGESRAEAGESLPYEDMRLEVDGQGLLPGRTMYFTFQEDCADYSLWLGDLSASVRIRTAADRAGEKRTLRLRAAQERPLHAVFSFRPVLARREDWQSHPSFWRLGLWSEERAGALLIRRLPRGDCPESWLCLRADRDLRFAADEEGGLGWLAAPRVRAECDLRPDAEGAAALSLALCLAPSAEEAFAGAGRILAAPELERGRMIGGAATRLGLDPAQIGRAMDMLPALCQPQLWQAAPRRELWAHGLSGDLPIIGCRSSFREAEALLRRFLLLKSAGLEADLVYFCPGEGEYHQPFRRGISRQLALFGLEALLDAPGGVHLLPEKAEEAVLSRSALAPGTDRPRREALVSPALGLPRRPGTVPVHRWQQRRFVFEAGGALPGRPWQHLLSNGAFGWVFSECGSGFLWRENARELALTEPPALPEDIRSGEALWLETEAGPVSLFAANDDLPCAVSYEPGLAVWEKQLGDRRIKTTAFLPGDTAARLLLVEGAEGLTLCWQQRFSQPEAARVTAENGLFRLTDPDCYLPDTVYLAFAGPSAALRCDFAPAAMELRVPCAHLSVLGCGCCGEEELRRLCRPSAALAELGRESRRWAELCKRAALPARDAAMAHYLGGWAVCQVIVCRLLGRTSLYQRGGAYGFRDQLQDAANILYLEPRYLRERLLDAAAHQYEEGDVMHWWHPHPDGDRGLRSRCSDDLLWLPWALCEWVEGGGDRDLARQEAPFLSSPPLSEEERDRYETPPRGASASLLAHACAALDCCVRRGFGGHGLPWMGGGDWNDGLDRAGGESVWLGFFLAHVASRFASLLEALGEADADAYRALARQVGQAADAAFSGGRYLRGYRGDGRALGGGALLDSTVQSWAVLSGFGSPEKCAAALDSAASLIDRTQGLVRLFDPPYAPGGDSPGYISSYGEGFRENGGQYTHGAVWLAMAMHRAGRREEAREILRLLLPENHDAARYGAEPYVLPADVYAAPGRAGRAGWTWYTGSAGWYLRAAREIFSSDGA